MSWTQIASALRHTLLLCAFILPSTATAVPLENITLPLPVGTSNHGTPGLLCTPTKWTDVVLFFLFNYIAHAATVLTRPGERSVDFVVSVFGCLLLPVLGLYRGIDAIFSGAVFVRGDDLRKAARSGALCMVVRGRDWRPVDGDAVHNAICRSKQCTPDTDSIPNNDALSSWNSDATVTNESSVHVVVYSPPWIRSKFGSPVYVSRQIVHGKFDLPKGYRLAIVPPDAQFTTPSTQTTVVEISATHNAVKALLALVQACYALATLYRSQGDQVEQFGYAAFGLTVTPYAIMSVINLLGNICRPDYASLYIVESSAMDEARKRGAVFEGVVGRLLDDDATVCNSSLTDGRNVSHLHFSADEKGDMTAKLTLDSPPPVCFPDRASSKSELCASRASLTPQIHLVEPLPERLNYAGTGADQLLLVPCCDPIQRAPTTHVTADEPSRYLTTKLRLCQTNPPCKSRVWVLTFAPTPAARHAVRWYAAKYFLTTIIAFLPLAITGGISHFSRGSIPAKESETWRNYVIQWLVWGVFSGIIWVFDQEWKDASPVTEQQYRPVIRLVLYIASGSSAVGVFVVVGQMLARYGVCVWIGD